jgi:hypothetical protein
MISLLIAACALLQDASPKKAPGAALFDELIRKTNALQSFVAVYRASRPESSERITVRMEYLAPDNMKLDFSGSTIVSMRAGVMDLRSAVAGEPPNFVHVPMAEMASERSLALAAVVHTEFPALAKEWTSTWDCGGQLLLSVSPSADGTAENVDLSLSYACPRKALLGWLETLPAGGAGTSQDDEHVVFPTPAGGVVTLNTRSGFVESLAKKNENGEAAFRLESLDVAPKLTAESFAVPAPSAAAIDGSAPFAGRWHEMLTAMGGRRFVGWVSERVADKKLAWDADARVHARKALGVLYTDGIALESQPWMAATQDRVEKFATWLAQRYAALPAGDKAKREEIDATIKEARATLVKTLDQMLENRVAGLNIPEETVPDAELRQSLLELEQGATRSAFAKALHEPAVASFDERIERVKR